MTVPKIVRVSQMRGKIDFGIITIREDEFGAVLDRFPVKWLIHGEEQYNIAEVISRSGKLSYAAIIRTSGPGHASAQSAASHLLSELDPSCFVLIGICGAKPESEFTLGDVFVATQFHDFSVTGAPPGGEAETAATGAPAHRIAQTALTNLRATRRVLGDWNSEAEIGIPLPGVSFEDENFVTTDTDWNKKIRRSLDHRFMSSTPPRQPLVTAGTLASGAVLVKDHELLKRWLKHARDLKAVEMEHPGVLAAVRSVIDDRPVVVIRGISDVVGYKRDADWTEYACHSAASFARAFLASELLNIDPKQKPKAPDDIGPSIRRFGTLSENPDRLAGAPVWDVYKTLFPDEKERDAPEDIIDWLHQGWRSQGEWSEVFFTLSDNRKVVGMAYLSLLRPLTNSVTRPKGWWFSNYFGILKGWRMNQKAAAFLSEIMKTCHEILPDSKGIVFEVERYSDDDIQSVLMKFGKRREGGPQMRGRELREFCQTLTEDEKYSVRAARRVGLYTGAGDRGPQEYLEFTRALSLVYLVDAEPRFVDYIQPAMTKPLDETNEVKLWLMVYPMPGLNVDVQGGVRRILSPEEVDEIFGFIYGDLFPSAYSRDYEGADASAIDGFNTYVKALRGRVQNELRGKQVALVAQNMLSKAARRLIALHKRELDGMGLDL